jgi:hypothetical protein
MHRQVVNPANGWNDPEYAAQAESEPTNLRQIKGNYTHDDRCGELPGVPGNQTCDAGDVSPSAAMGYLLTVPISMANDYNGYIATYREYQRGDHYRKALTGWGPHSSDYMATRLVNMGRVMNGGDRAMLLPPEYGDGKVPADLALNDARAQALGVVGASATAAYEQRLPNDGGPAAAVIQPRDVERFGGTFFTWVGGSNYSDDPKVVVQRLVNGEWKGYAGQSGEVPVTIAFPQGTEAPSFETGSFKWRWTAHFEVFGARFTTVEGNRQTLLGTYRFAVDGRRRQGGRLVPYSVVSHSFQVLAWSGIAVEDLRVDPAGTVSFRVGPRSERTLSDGLGSLTAEIGPIDYPDSYSYGSDGPLPRFIERNWRGTRDPDAPADPAKITWLCDECSFRPWLDAGNATSAVFTFVGTDGVSRRVGAVEQGGRWVSKRLLASGEHAFVAAGDVRDGIGNVNGTGSPTVSR